MDKVVLSVIFRIRINILRIILNFIIEAEIVIPLKIDL